MKMGYPWESENELNLYWLLSTSEGGPLLKVCFPNKIFVAQIKSPYIYASSLMTYVSFSLTSMCYPPLVYAFFSESTNSMLSL